MLGVINVRGHSGEHMSQTPPAIPDDPVGIIMGSINSFLRGFIEHLPALGLAVLVLLLTFVIARILRFVVTSAMKKTHTRQALITLATNLIGIASWIIGFAIAVTVIFPSVTPAKLIAGLGLGSVAIGFAFKDIFENFLAGVIILGREKMRIGDIIECEGVYGRIEKIAIRETHVRETDGELVIVPNAFLFQNPLKIQTDQNLKRNELVVGVDYDASLPACRDALQAALDGSGTVDGDKGTEVKCIAFGGSSIDFKLLWWSDSQPKAQRASFDEVAFAVKAELDKAGISIPFPQSTLSFRPEAQPLRLAGPGRNEDGSEQALLLHQAEQGSKG